MINNPYFTFIDDCIITVNAPKKDTIVSQYIPKLNKYITVDYRIHISGHCKGLCFSISTTNDVDILKDNSEHSLDKIKRLNDAHLRAIELHKEN